jgi:hypothetical protein
MDSDETQHLLPGGDTVWVLSTPAASENLANLLTLFRSGATEPLIFGDAGQPEGVVIPFEVWRALVEASIDEEGFDSSYSEVRHRLKHPGGPSIPIEDLEAELGFSLHDDLESPQPN